MVDWRRILTFIVASVTAVLILSQTGALFLVDLLPDQRNSQLVDAVPIHLEENLRREGIHVTVIDVRCEDLPAGRNVFTVSCDVVVEELSRSFEAIAQGSSTDGSIDIEEVFPRERLVTEEQAVAYVQRLVRTRVMNCDLGGPIAILRQGNEFNCETDADEIVTIAVAANGSGSISRVQKMPGT